MSERARTADPAEPLTVSEVTRRVKQVIEGGFPSVLIQGELSNVKRHTSGHLYFTLKDDAAQISGVLWRSRASSLKFSPEDGIQVVVSGRITLYEPRGAYQIDALSMRPVGVGELQRAFDALKAKLSAEGLFASGRKRALPPLPERIGVVTSPTGAVLQDMKNVFRQRFPGVQIILVPVRVQGNGAAAEIAGGIRDLNAFGRVDVIIVARGGGIPRGPVGLQ